MLGRSRALNKSPGKKDFFRKLRVRAVTKKIVQNIFS